MNKKSTIFFIISLFSFTLSYSQKSIDARVDSVLRLMNFDEKVGQLTLFTSDWDVTGPTIRKGYSDDIRSGKCGNIFNAHTADYTRKLQEIAVKETRLKIPLLFGYDVIHGYKTIFPIPLGESASWDLEAIEKSSQVAAAEAAASGLHWTFAPMVDISRDPRWGRCMEGAGEDPYLGSKIAAARTRGFQGNIGSTNRVMACVKHFAAYGAAIAGRDYNAVDMSELQLREIYLPTYKAAVDAGALSVMTSFNEINGVPSSANKQLLTDILRKEWGFKGFVVTDYTSINEMVNHGNVVDDKDAGEKALNAGVDMDMQGAVYYNYLKKSLAEGKVTMTTIDESVRRILRVKFQLGLFENPYKFSDTQREKNTMLSEANQAVARDVTKRSFVLLKNDGNVLPFNKNIKTLAVIGPLAESDADVIGSWSGAGDAKNSISVLKGLKNNLPNTAIIYAQGCDLENSGHPMKGSNMSTAGFAGAVAAANQSDAVVVVVGERSWMTGEASCRSDISIPGVQKELVLELLKTGKPVVVVLMNGRPITFPEIADKAPAILETWFGGTQTGNAVYDVLFGDYNPSGKLTMSFPRSVGQIPIYYSQKNTGRPADPNGNYTSKYLDIPNTPQYVFGYGLSYTTFEYSNLAVNKTTFGFKDKLDISVTVKNTGIRDGEEVVQLYVRDLVGSITRPIKELKGFNKIMLKAGASKVVTFTLSADDLAFYHSDLTRSAEAGDFDIMVGGNSTDIKTVRVNLK